MTGRYLLIIVTLPLTVAIPLIIGAKTSWPGAAIFGGIAVCLIAWVVLLRRTIAIENATCPQCKNRRRTVESNGRNQSLICPDCGHRAPMPSWDNG